jgi:hypothetical protein
MTVLLWVAAFTPGTEAPRAVPPADVRAVIERRTGCDHWQGEDPYDAERGRQIEKAIRALRCATIDADEAKMRARYRSRPDIVRLLQPPSDPPP